MRIRIRQAHLEDATSVAFVHAKSFIAAHQRFMSKKTLSEFTEQHFIKRWEKRLLDEKQTTYIAEMDKKTAGLITFRCQPKRNTAEILFLYIKPAFWRKGIGKRLISFVLKIFHQKNIKKVIIWVLKSNPKSRAFYESIGAVTEGESEF